MTDPDDRPDLPPHWRWVPLGTLGKWGSGGTPKRTVSAYYGEGTRWLKIGDLDDGPVLSAETSITDEGLDNSSAKLIPQGTLLVAMYGSIGKLGITRFECATNQAIAHLQVDDSLATVRFLYFALLRHRQDLIRLGKGGTQQNISQTVLKAFEIALPPLPEQQRIVDAIESVFADLDAGVAALTEARAGLDRYRQSVLKAAVEGALTADWRAAHPATEPASALLSRVAEERREQWEADQLAKYQAKGKTPPKNWRQRYKPAAETESDGLGEVPEGWAWASVDQLAALENRSITDGPFGSNLKTAHYTDSGPRVIRLQNIGDGEFIDVYAHVSQEHFDTLDKHHIEAGDLVIASLGEELPRACIVPASVGPALVKADCVRFKPNADAVLPTFALFALNAPPTRERTAGSIHGVGRPRLNLGTLRTVALPVPSPDEQTAIVEAIEERLSVTDAVAAEIDRQLIRAERLRRSVLHRAFSGGLVPQETAEHADGDRQRGGAQGVLEFGVQAGNNEMHM